MADEADMGGAEAGTDVSPETTDLGQGTEGSGASDTDAGGQGSADSPDKGQGKAAPKSKGDGEPEKPQWDADTSKWMKSKGYDTEAFDPGNEVHSNMIKSHREAERGLTQQRTSERTKEVMDRVMETRKEPAKKEPELSPSQVVTKDYEAVKAYTFQTLGVEDMAGLRAVRPDIADKMQDEYDRAWRQSIREDGDWQRRQETAERAEKEQKEVFQRNFDEARRLTDSNLAKLRQDNPMLDNHLKDSGMEKLLSHLEDQHSLWREMLFVNPDTAKFLADAAEAIEYRKSEPDRLEQWKQDYEKQQIEFKKASGPRPAGHGSSAQGLGVSGGDWSKTMDAVSKPLI